MKLTSFGLAMLLILPLLCCKEEKENSQPPATDSSPAEQLAEHYGIDNFHKVETLRFTFNVEAQGNTRSRSYIWKPKTSDITFMSNTDTIQYNRASLDSISEQADKAFINDSYWLLAPFKLVWDDNTEVSEETKATAPISKENMNKLSLSYTGDDGYTPGDAYDFYYTDDKDLKEWSYRRGNQAEVSLSTTWENPKDYQGITIFTEHKNPESGFRLFFTDIEVETSKD